MTQVTMIYAAPTYRLTAEGHAGNARACAGVSAILTALAGWIENNRAMFPRAEVRLDSGDVHIEAVGGADLKAAFDTAVVGLAQIAKDETQGVKVVCKALSLDIATRGANPAQPTREA